MLTGYQLTEEDVREIRTRLDISTGTFGRRFGVCAATIWAARAGKTWRHLKDPPPVRLGRGGVNAPTRLARRQRARYLRKLGWTYAQIGEALGVRRAAVHAMLRREDRAQEREAKARR